MFDVELVEDTEKSDVVILETLAAKITNAAQVRRSVKFEPPVTCHHRRPQFDQRMRD